MQNISYFIITGNNLLQIIYNIITIQNINFKTLIL